jgi:hypothetical protein
MKQIRNKLLNVFLHQIDPSLQKEFKDWIKDLLSYGIDSKRLACCIAIDVNNKTINIDKYVNIFNKINYSSTVSPNQKFENVIRANHNLHNFSNNHTSISTKFAKVLTIEDLIDYYLKPAKMPYTIHDKSKVKKKIINGDFENIVLPINSGPPPREICWMVPINELELCIEKAKSNNLSIADQVIDRLGLDREFLGTTLDPCPEYAYIVYPDNFKEKSYQPNAINASWNSLEGLYLSYKENDLHGRTRPLKGDKINRRFSEKIHKGVISYIYKYSIRYIGKTSHETKSIKSIVNNAKLRYYGK